MRHPTDGTLRRLLDEPAGVTDVDREHVAACPTCLAELVTVQEDAAVTAAALDPHAAVPDADVDRAWQRLSRAAVTGGSRPAPVRRRRLSLRSPIVAAAGVLVLLAGAGAAAAGDWVQIFRAEEVAPVTVAESDLVDLPDLSAYGDVEVIQQPDLRQVEDAAAAEDAVDLSLPEVDDLPRGVTGEPVYRVGDRMSAVFTFSARKAERAAAAAGDTLPTLPEGLDGSRFRLVAGPGVAAVWAGNSGLPGLAVARAVAPTAYSSGVPFETARDYLLSLPGMPDSLADQLRSFSADGTTLPLPIPAAQVTSSSADVDGVPATVVTSRDGTMAGVVWVDDGIVNAVAGTMSADEVLSVARGLG